eukprot:14803790-Alexandrium_andersonii.AAC.1
MGQPRLPCGRCPVQSGRRAPDGSCDLAHAMPARAPRLVHRGHPARPYAMRTARGALFPEPSP